MPSLSVEGRVYPAGPVATALSNIVFIIRLLCIAVIIGGGPEMLQRFGINNTPQWLLWMFENKMASVLLLVVIGGQIENQLLSTGAFEVYLNEKLVWSKLDSGRLPSFGEFKSLLDDPSIRSSSASFLEHNDALPEMES
ncbi:PREDICTED: selenoprotein T2-like [Amphimedon queenslandica]|uniref:Selenoprotein T n=1 Tax=Amphimedon queenslandica TaxID=400682 RepID=A0A1X7VQ82_AMPQE|nr:PREDICTED: selenoprotein T2-like [Amphimedon queenslandica]|eukprot:XP_019857946.1 PREDICTED: selenoprotein T2-like [Amphimedon queenslandica]